MNDVTYSSYSGCDIVASITIPNLNLKPYVIGSLQTVSYSIHREVSPVRVLGKINPNGFVSGPRTVAGSLIFTVFDSNLVHKIVKIMKEGYNSRIHDTTNYKSEDILQYASKYNDRIYDAVSSGSYSVMDEMPPFDITISFMNEYGNYSTLVIKGVIIVDEGQVMSIEDMITENTMSYMAHDIQVLSYSGKMRSLMTDYPDLDNSAINLSNDTALKSLKVSFGIMESFDPAKFDYLVTVPKGVTTAPTITAVASDSNSTVTITKGDTISTRAKIVVKAVSGNTATYYIRYKAASNNTTLKYITINGKTIDNFQSLCYNYTIETSATQSIPKVYGAPTDSDAIMTINRTYKLPGATTITVESADGSDTSVYTIDFVVTDLNTNAYLSNIVPSFGALTPIFNKDTYAYAILLDGAGSLPIINAKAEDTTATITITQPTAFSGSGAEGRIVVTAQDGTTKTYTATIAVI